MDIIEFAEQRRDECVKHDEFDNLRYWVGYIDGAKRALSLDWVGVDERLPEESDEYLCALSDTHMIYSYAVLQFDANRKMWNVRESFDDETANRYCMNYAVAYWSEIEPVCQLKHEKYQVCAGCEEYEDGYCKKHDFVTSGDDDGCLDGAPKGVKCDK